ncbi:MAG TPA: FtsX-like permease family protein [Solirubrobacter sp.]|nr:FtsX-like permease family protein [Solirubrobacter sp.]
MTKLALRGLLTRKLRSVLTGFAVVIGVAFVVGTLIFTATIDESFKDLFERTQKGVDVQVQSAQPVKADFSIPPPMPRDTLEKVRAVDGVDVADGDVSYQFGTILDKKGKPIVSNGPPTLLVDISTESVFNVLEYEDGGPPQNDNEVVLDKGTADRFDFKVGDPVTISGAAPAKRFTVSGIATVGGNDNLGGARVVAMTEAEAHRMAGYDGYDSISISTGGADPDEVKAAVQRALGPKFEVRTGKEAAEQQAQDLSEALGFIRIALLIFAGVALLVGGFLIFNTFTVTVAQRTKEFALLRVIGASRRQIMRSVIIETFAVGLAASVLGVMAGLVVAPGLSALMEAGGVDLGTTGMVISPSTVVIGLAVGLVATMVSGVVPARRATRVEPVAAMHDAVTPSVGHLGTRRIVGSLALMALGLIALFYGLFGDIPEGGVAAGIVGLGAVLMMFGFAFLAPLLVRPLSRIIGAPLVRLRGLTGRLARENAMRQPQRTAVTAAALMVGLALVVMVAIFAASLGGSTSKTIDEEYKADLIVQNQDGFSPIPAAATDTVANLPGVGVASPTRLVVGEAEGDTGTTAVTGIDPQTIGEVRTLEWIEGDASTLSAMTDGDAVVDADWAESRELAVGDTVRFTTPTGARERYRIVGTFNARAGLTTNVVLTNAALERSWGSKEVQQILASAAPGTNPDQLQRQAEQALRAFPSTEPLTKEGFKDKQEEAINQLLGLVYGLLMLSVIVALLGIVNTLALSVHERTRELGMLRAVGMSRRQVRRMVSGESVITAGIGAILGIVLGTVFALVISRPLADEGLVFILPVGTLILFFVLAVIAGVLAAIPPARRASRVDVLRAVTTE